MAMLKLGLDSVYALISKKSIFETVIKQFFKYSNLGFSLGIGIFSGVYKFVLCLMRRLWNKEDYKNSLIASMIASFAILLDRDHKRRITMIYVILCWSFDMMKNVVCQKTKLKKINHFEVYILCLMGIFMWNWFCTDHTVISTAFIETWRRVSNAGHNDLAVMRTIFQRPRWSTPYKQ